MIARGTPTRGTRKPVATTAFAAALVLTLTATQVVATPGSSGQALPTTRACPVAGEGAAYSPCSGR